MKPDGFTDGMMRLAMQTGRSLVEFLRANRDRGIDVRDLAARALSDAIDAQAQSASFRSPDIEPYRAYLREQIEQLSELAREPFARGD